MHRRPRGDEPGARHHLFARGIAHRPVFARRSDARGFLALLARQVRAGRIALLAYCLMTTHFHLLVESVEGDLSSAMREVLNRYVRRYNRTHGRDGPLFRSRFGSRRIQTERYLHAVHHYIDFNPVAAGMVTAPWDYTYGSARHYVAARRPVWLDTAWIDGWMGSPPPELRRSQYAAVFGHGVRPCDAALVRGRMRHGAPEQDPLDDLLLSTPQGIRDWLAASEAAADGRSAAGVYVGAHVVERAVHSVLVRPALRPLLLAGLLRTVSGGSMQEISMRTGTSPSTATWLVAAHRRRLRTDPAYLRIAAATTHAALQSTIAPPHAPRR